MEDNRRLSCDVDVGARDGGVVDAVSGRVVAVEVAAVLVVAYAINEEFSHNYLQ